MTSETTTRPKRKYSQPPLNRYDVQVVLPDGAVVSIKSIAQWRLMRATTVQEVLTTLRDFADRVERAIKQHENDQLPPYNE